MAEGPSVTIAGATPRDSPWNCESYRIKVTQSLNRHDWCMLTCSRATDHPFPVDQALGSDVGVSLGEWVLFRGSIVEVKCVREKEKRHTVRILAVSRSYRLTLASQEAYFANATLDDLARKLCADAGLAPPNLSHHAPPAPRNYVQWGSSHFAFLRRVADDHQCWIRPAGDGIEIGQEFENVVAISEHSDQSLIGFEWQGRLAPIEFRGIHYDPLEMMSATGGPALEEPAAFETMEQVRARVLRESKKLPPGYICQDARSLTAAEYEALLKRESARAQISAVSARGESRDPRLRPGCIARVHNFAGGTNDYGVVSVSHTWHGKYENSFTCTPWKRWMAARRPAMRRVDGVVPALVVDHDDPKGIGRVRVKYDWQEAEGDMTDWMRIATPHAGVGRGFMFLPEKGDEVLVAFEHGDPERPYVVGAVWNGVAKAPREDFRKDDVKANDVKRIVTKSGNRVQLVDTNGNEAIVVATPQHVKLSMLESCEETGDRPMLLLHTDGDIVLSAPEGRIHCRSKYFSREVGAEVAPPTPPPPGRVSPISVSTATNTPPRTPARVAEVPPLKAGDVIAPTDRVARMLEYLRPQPHTTTPNCDKPMLFEDYDRYYHHEHKDKDAKCAHVFFLALEHAGFNTEGHEREAHQAGDYIKKLGFTEQTVTDIKTFQFKPGDVVVLGPCKGKGSDGRMKDNRYGHVAVWNGTNWVSDFVQPQGRDVMPGPSYRNADPAPKIHIFRYEPSREEKKGE